MKALLMDSFEKGNRTAIRLIKRGWEEQTANLKYIPQLTQFSRMKRFILQYIKRFTKHKSRILTSSCIWNSSQKV